MNDQVTFGTIVKERRDARGLTQAELARRVGCAVVTIRKIEYDALRPSVQIAERLALALGVPEQEQLAFVRLARQEPPLTPLPPPPPEPEEIGQADLSGRAVRGYQLGERLGSGGYGAVYKARQITVDREVAVKIILPKYADHPDFIRRFEAEAQLVARLEHPHIVPLYDYWREPSAAYLVMRYLRGGNLEEALEKGPLGLDDFGRVVAHIGEALHAAHRAGVIHRDIKPANVLLDNDHNAYLADFGIAKDLVYDERTQEGVLIGSPAYISPEQIRAEPVKPYTDIYSLGVLLYELLTGQKPFRGPTPVNYLQQHLNEPLPSLTENDGALAEGLDNVLRKATAKEPLDRYGSVPEFLTALQEAVATADTVLEGTAASAVADTAIFALSTMELVEVENPYKGLRAFTEGDADDFYGRETLVQALLSRLSESHDLARFLAIVGPSGSGKSSVVKAGLIPSLRHGGLPGSEKWFVIEMMPGTHPFEELEAALLRVAVNPPTSLLAQLREDERGLLRAVRRVLPADPDTELVLIVDQFEELFTLVQDEADRAHFMDGLVTAVLDARSRLRLVITLRADFTDRPLAYVDFGELMRQRTEFVLPLSPDELEQAIARPVAPYGIVVEPELVATIIHDVGDQPGTLPLLQYVLTELFERRQGQGLTLANYRAYGGVLGALGRRADEIYEGLEPGTRAATRQIFLRLVTLGEGVEDTRRRVLRSELEAIATKTNSNFELRISTLIDAFGAARLLTFDRDPLTRGPTVEVAHEALLREWQRLRSWLDEGRDDIRLQRRLARAIREWQQASRDPGFLLRGSRLDQYADWAAESSLALTADEQAFLQASIDSREARLAEEEARRQRELETARVLAETERNRAEEQAQAAGRLRRRAVYLTGALVTALVLAVLAFFFARQSNLNAAVAEENAASAQENAALAAAREAEALAEAGQRATAQAQAESERQRADEQRASAVAAEEAAVAEAEQRATAEAIAVLERHEAEAQARLASSRELAAAAISNLDVDPELSILLSLQALAVTHTLQAENALHHAIPASPVELTLAGHSDNVGSVVFSPDGEMLASGGADQTVKLWDTKSGNELMTLSGHEDWVNALAFSPEGEYLVSVSDDMTAKVWDADSGEILQTLSGHTDWVYGVSFSPDGERLATASLDGLAKIWDVATGQELLEFTGHTDAVNFVSFSPDGALVATASDDGTVKLWDATTGQEVLTLSAHDSAAFGVIFSPDGTRLATEGNGVAKIWDLVSPGTEDYGQLLFAVGGLAAGTGASTISFLPDGSGLLALAADGSTKIWEAETGQERQSVICRPKTEIVAAISPDGAHVAVAGENGVIKVCSLSPNHELLTLTGHSGTARDAAFSQDDTLLYSASTDGTVKVWDLGVGVSDREIMSMDSQGDRFYNVELSPDGTRLATSSFDGIPRIWDGVTGELLLELTGHDSVVWALAFSPDGTMLAGGGVDQTVKLWDPESGEELLTLVGHEDRINALAFSPEGEHIATVGNDMTARIWDANTGQELASIEHSNWLWAVAFSPDGKLLATAGNESVVRLWDFEALVEDGSVEEVGRLTGHTGLITEIVFSPDGRRLASASLDNTAKIWDTSSGQELLTLPGHADVVWSLTFNPDGTHLATASWDGTVRVYVLELEELIALARTRLTRALTDEECRQYLHVESCPAAP